MNAPTASSSLREFCLQHLEALKSSISHFRMAVVSSVDGFPIALLGVEPQTGRKTTAMSAALDGLSKTIAKELQLGNIEGAVLECELGLVLCRQVYGPKRNLVLLMVVSEQATYGQALWAVKNAAKEMTVSLHEQVELALSQPFTQE